MKSQLLTLSVAAALVILPDGAKAQSQPGNWSLNGKNVDMTGQNGLQVAPNQRVTSEAPAAAYELTFEALVPQVSKDLPDLATPQIWCAVDFQNELNQVAFSIRGGRLQDVISYRLAQRGWSGPVSEKWGGPENRSLFWRFSKIPTEAQTAIEPGKWVPVRVQVGGESAALFVNDKLVLSAPRNTGKSSGIALGGSWQSNTFRNVTLKAIDAGVVPPVPPAKVSKANPNEPISESDEARRVKRRASYKPLKLPEIPQSGLPLEEELHGDWLFMPEAQVKASEAVTPAADDSRWHTLPVPGFWNPVGWWIYGQGERSPSMALLYDEMARCEALTFDWKTLTTGWYRHYLEIPDSWKGRQVTLHFEGVATTCDVFINGTRAGGNVGMFAPFSVDVTPYVKTGSTNLLAIRVSNGERTASKKADDKEDVAVTMKITPDMATSLPRGMYIQPLDGLGNAIGRRQGGIWLPASIRASAPITLGEIWPKCSMDALDLQVSLKGAQQLQTVQAFCRLTDSQGREVLSQKLPFTAGVGDPLAAKRFEKLPVELWSPEKPNLYTLEISAEQDGRILDKRQMKVGFREFRADKGQLLLNGKPWRFLGANSPPHGIRPNDKTLATAFTQLMREGNQRATRSHGSPGTSAWLDESDRLGVTVGFEGQWPWVLLYDQPIPDAATLDAWKKEWIAIVKANRHRPSILLWTISNENYLDGDTDPARRKKKWEIWQDITRATREADPTRPVVLWSGFKWNEMKKSLDGLVANPDLGDIDDLHTYAGTYESSPIGTPGYWPGLLKSKKIEGRPLISQEAATAYASSDVGHQELSYIGTWHAQIWTGNESYPWASPQTFLERVARNTQEQMEMARREDIQGWLLFSNATWVSNVDSAAHIQPYPAYYSAARALQPRLAALLRPPLRIEDGTAEALLKLFVINDAEELLGSDWTVDLELVTEKGQCLGKMETVKFAEPALGGGKSELAVKLPLRSTGMPERQRAFFRLKAHSGGKLISENQYEVDLFPKLLNAHAQVKVVRDLLTKTSGELETRKGFVAVKPGKDKWPELLARAEKGGRVLVVSPESLPDASPFSEAIIRKTDSAGETANISLEGTRVGLAKGLLPRDIGWWESGQERRLLFQQALVFNKPLPESVRPWIEKTQPHAYGSNWRMLFPVVEFEYGKGSVVISFLESQSVKQDPAAAELFKNLVETVVGPGS